MKKKIAVFCALVMVMACFAQSVGAINVIMNSSFVKFPDQEPVVENGTTLVPIRTIAELLGLEVLWDDPTDTVTLKKDNFFVELVIGSTTAKTSSGTKQLTVAPKIINKRTMVPLRFIAEELGLQVSWNQEYQRVVIAGEVDTQTVVVPIEEAPTDVNGEATVPVEGASEVSEEPTEEETEIVEENNIVYIEAGSSVITIDFPLSYYAEDTASEESFAYRSLDAFDAQHKYNWEIVTQYESYVDEAGENGFLFVVQTEEAYQGEEYDVEGIATMEYPEPPERPERPESDFDEAAFNAERGNLITQQLFADLEKEVPENLEETGLPQMMVVFADIPVEWIGSINLAEEILEFFGMSVEELKDQVDISKENVDLTEVPGYDEYIAYEEENQAYQDDMQVYREDYMIYQGEVAAINAAKSYAIRHFGSLGDKISDEDWVILFGNHLNSDVEVRYEGIEIVEIGEKKAIHATIYAEDPDDEQGVYDYYFFRDGDCVVTIWGGTLFGGEASPEVVDILSNMTIE